MKMDQVIGAPMPDIMPIKNSLPDNLSPQCIGQEFVRCYYTLLHENPNKLHRFYLDQSTFVHGDQTDEAVECVSGQRAIHEKIMSLRFEDCRTKIKHVDSQPTLDQGVVVQVSGELSNAGNQPRRFMQTFVLGCQTARKYYLHNDIFRYQDEVFGYDHDDVVDDEVDSISSHEDIMVNNEPVIEHVDVEPLLLSNPTPFMPQEEIALNGTSSLLNQSFHSEIEDPEPCFTAEPEEEIEQPFLSEPIPEPVPEFEEPEIETPPVEEELVPEPEEFEEVIEAFEPEPVPEVPSGPKSWAMIAGARSGGAPPARVTPVPQQVRDPPKPVPEVKEAAPKKESTFKPFDAPKEGTPPAEGAPKREAARGGRGRARGGAGFAGTDRRFQERDAPNAHQIFVGNLPNNTVTEDLGKVFDSYGKVVHVRVTPNNFGFVVFESDDPVQTILEAVKTGVKFFLAEQRLNVEEKKTAISNSRGPRKPFNDSRGSRRGGPRRGGRPINSEVASEPK